MLSKIFQKGDYDLDVNYVIHYKMIILASDTSTKSLSVAICQDGISVAHSTKQTGTTHSQTHMPTIQKLLDDSNLHFADIDLYACTVGPGSYTGIRIGVSTTKTMAYASKKCAVGVSTLEVLAIPHHAETKMVCPILDARSRRVFSSGYFSGVLVIPEANRTMEELLDLISEYIKLQSIPENNREPKDFSNCVIYDNEHIDEIKPKCDIKQNCDEETKVELVFCGDAASLYIDDPAIAEGLKNLLETGGLSKVSFLETVPEAYNVAKIANTKFCNMLKEPDTSAMTSRFYPFGVFSPFALEANYLSPSQAERMKTKLAKKKVEVNE